MAYHPLFTIIFIVTFCTCCHAQNYGNRRLAGDIELYLGDGFASSTEVAGILGNGDDVEYARESPGWYTGALAATIRYYHNDRIAIGGSITIDHFGGAIPYFPGRYFMAQVATPSGTYFRQAYTFAPELTFVYFKRSSFMGYGSLGVGITSWKETYSVNNYGQPTSNNSDFLPISGSYFNGNFTAFGLRCGNTWAYFFELGLGYKGLINMGISRRIVPGKKHETQLH